MKTDDFDYNLPEELIAQVPLEHREESRLLIMDRNNGDLKDEKFYNIINLAPKLLILLKSSIKSWALRLLSQETGNSL